MQYFHEEQFNTLADWLITQVKTKPMHTYTSGQYDEFKKILVEKLMANAQEMETKFKTCEMNDYFTDYLKSRYASILLRIDNEATGIIAEAAFTARISALEFPQYTNILVRPDCTTILIQQNGVNKELKVEKPKATTTENSQNSPAPRIEIASNDDTTIYSSEYISEEGRQPCAIKKFKKTVEAGVEIFENERNAYKILFENSTHPNITRFFGVNEIEKEISTELAPSGSLWDYINNHSDNPGLVTLQRLNICMDVLRGLMYMHSLGLIHRDLKSENVLNFHDKVFKICDFGFTVKTQNGKYYDTEPRGTPMYIAPESLNKLTGGTPEYSTATDLWQFAAGVLIPTISCNVPYNDACVNVFNENLFTFLGCVHFGSIAPDANKIKEGPVRNLALSIFNKEPSRRATTAKAMEIIENEKQRLELL